ncbi:hypothetical protein RB213_003289, partial [Colletotrichum asianum]
QSPGDGRFLLTALSPALSPPEYVRIRVRNLAGRHRHLGSGQLTSDTRSCGLWSCLVRRSQLRRADTATAQEACRQRSPLIANGVKRE